MAQQGTHPDFTGQVIHVGIDTGKRNWDVEILVNEVFWRRYSMDPSPEQLVTYLHRHFPGARYRSVYEAGYCGFWIHERLVALGVDNIVINPADVPTSDKERVHKNNRVDARKLVWNLARGSLNGLYIPTRRMQEDRSLVRLRTMTVQKQTRCKNQIKALLSYYGYRMPEGQSERYWSRAYIRWIESLQLTERSGQHTLRMLLNELMFLRSQILEVTRRIRELSRDLCYARNVQLLCGVSGIGMVTSMVLLTELADIARFHTPDQLASFVGLVPGEHSTGDETHTTGLTHRRNPFLRHMLIEAAWIAIRTDAALMLAYTTLSKRMKKTEAIVRIARKLINRIRYVMKTGEAYVPALVSSRA
jgi:transposase